MLPTRFHTPTTRTAPAMHVSASRAAPPNFPAVPCSLPPASSPPLPSLVGPVLAAGEPCAAILHLRYEPGSFEHLRKRSAVVRRRGGCVSEGFPGRIAALERYHSALASQ